MSAETKTAGAVHAARPQDFAGLGFGAQPARGEPSTLLVPGNFEARDAEPGETPMAYIQRWVTRRMSAFGGRGARMADRVLAVLAETGAGKSTTMPVWLFRILRSERTAPQVRFRKPGVLCTQPRVLTAISLAETVAAERVVGGARARPNPDMVMGLTCGYQTGLVTAKPPSGLIFATIGVLAAQLMHWEDAEVMARYQIIVFDEAHERSLESDMALLLLKNFYHRNAGNERLPFLILASATFDPERYTSYFGVGPENVVRVRGRPHSIAHRWPAQGTNDYMAAAAAKVLQIHEDHADDPPTGADVLVFLPGAGEMVEVRRRLVEALKRPELAARPFLLLELNREVVVSQSDDYQKLFLPPDRLPLIGGVRPARRVILSTVVAETGVTIPTLRHVVDSGWNRSTEEYYPWGVGGLVTRPAPRSRVKQRAGRVGRLFPGEFHPLYTENVYGALDADQLPDIATRVCGNIHLALYREQQRQKLRTGRPPEFRVEDLDLLDPPPADAFLCANAAAVALGFVSPRAPLPGRWPPAMLEAATATEPTAGPLAPARGYGLTSLGHLAAGFTRTSMEGVRILLAGYAWDVAVSDLVTVVAMAVGTGWTTADLIQPKPAVGAPLPGAGLPLDADALLASLPSFLAARTVEEGRARGGSEGSEGSPIKLEDLAKYPPPLESEYYYYRARLLLADTFAEAVLLFDAFAREVARSSTRALPQVAEWCARKSLSFPKMMELTRRRCLVIEELALAGLNPYRLPERRLSVLPAREFTEGLARFKRCLYEGHRARLLRYDPAHDKYLTAQGVQVAPPSLLAPALVSRLKTLGAAPAEFAPPRWLVTDRLWLAPTPRTKNEPRPPLLYVVKPGLVSFLDGFVAPDPDLDWPRTPGLASAAGPLPRLPGRNDREAGAPTAAEAGAQLRAYDRVLRAALEARDGSIEAPVQRLSEYIRGVLFSPPQQDVLITAPLGGPPAPPCPSAGAPPPGGSDKAALDGPLPIKTEGPPAAVN